MKSPARYKKIFFAWCLGAYRVTDKLEEQKKNRKGHDHLNLQGTEPGSCTDLIYKKII